MKSFRNIFLLLALIIVGGVALVFSSAIPSVRTLFGTVGIPHSWGIFRTDTNAGKVYFGVDPGPGYEKSQMIGNTLSGYIWIDTVGWTMFHNAEFLPSPSGSIRDPWTGSGYAWSDNAGWIDFSTVSYDPNTLTFSGYAWSDAIGWVQVGADSSAPADVVSATQVGSGFIGKVKVIGNIGSSRVYDVMYGVGDRYSNMSMTDYTNLVRKNVSILTRNLNTSTYNTFPYTATIPNKVNNVAYFQNTTSTPRVLKYSQINDAFQSTADDVRSIIVVGADVYVDTGVFVPSSISPHAILALKNEAGVGGNIYVHGQVTRIQASLFAEGVLYSGYMNSPSSFNIYNPDKISAGSNLPDYQLYLRGSLVSHNTIGGSSFTGSVPDCPYIEANCNYDKAIRYDLNYFRDYQTKSNPLNRGYINNTLDDFSMIIEYDARIISNPPPGLAI